MTKTKLPESKSFAVGDSNEKPISSADLCILDSPIPKPANGVYLPCIPSKLKPGDRIKQACDPFELVFRSYEPSSETLLAFFTLPDKTLKTVRVQASSILVRAEEAIFRPDLLKNPPADDPPETPSGSNLQVGDRVTFAQHWYGEDRECTGEIVKLEGQTAIVHFDAPHLEGPRELQAPIGIFARAKIPEINMLPEPEPEEAQAEIDRLERLGLPPPGAWIDLSTPAGTKFRQAKWKSREAIFDSGSNSEAKLKSRYIGKENGAEHREAIAQVERRKRIKKLKQKIAAQT